MTKSSMYIFFDDVVKEYQFFYGKTWEKHLLKDTLKYLTAFSRTTKIMIITNQNVFEIINWFKKNDLYQFIYDISNPQKTNFL